MQIYKIYKLLFIVNNITIIIAASICNWNYTIECAYSDNGTEYKGTPDHTFVALCKTNSIGQKFTRVRRPQTNGRAERVIKTILEMWQEQTIFTSRKDRELSLARFVNFYNTVKPHTGISNMTPYEKLRNFFFNL